MTNEAERLPPARPLVLMADDDEANLRYFGRVLARAGVAGFMGTSDPLRVPALVREHRPELVVLDLHMAPVDGLEVLGLLHGEADPADPPAVLMVTGDTTPATRQRALEAGVRDFLHKPLDPAEAALRVRNLLETVRLHRALRQQNRLLETRVAERTRALEAAHVEVTERLAQAAELRDDDTGQHTRRVGELSAAVAARLGLDDAAVDRIRRAAPLHDVGKIGIPDGILLKPGRLTAEERILMERHTVIGARILADGRSTLMRTAERIARSHHERWDGAGYPDRLAGAAIPLEARIVAVADFYDALTHARPYRGAWCRTRVLETIRTERGRHFDPAVADAFIGVAERGGVLTPA